MTFTIDNSITLKTNAALYIRNIMINNGTNQIGGVAQFTDATSVYDDNGITEYNGSVTQNIELKNLNNLVIDNTGDSVHSTIDSLFIEGDFTVENGDFKTPFYMSVAGLMTMQTGTNLTIHDFSTLEVTGNVNSQTANDLQVDGFGTTDATLTLKSDIVGNGTFSANSYSISPFTVFGFTDPPTEVFLAAHNWSAGGADNDWNNTDNWSNKKVPGKGTDVTIDPATQEGEYPVISTPDAECKSLTLNPNTQLWINNGGTLDIGKDVRIETSSELTMDNGTMTVDQKQNGFIQITGGTLQLDNSSQVEIGNFIHVLSGGFFILDNSSVSIGANLNIDGSTVTLRNNATGQVNGDIDVNSGSELKLESNANLNIGN
jgi:hypothetical protein